MEKGKIIKLAIKNNCGKEGCEIKPYYVPVAKPKNLIKENLVRKAA